MFWERLEPIALDRFSPCSFWCGHFCFSSERGRFRFSSEAEAEDCAKPDGRSVGGQSKRSDVPVVAVLFRFGALGQVEKKARGWL
jgi:hypothetical protein